MFAYLRKQLFSYMKCICYNIQSTKMSEIKLAKKHNIKYKRMNPIRRKKNRSIKYISKMKEIYLH